VLHPDLLLFGITGDVKHNPFLLDGDVVRVPFEDVAATISGGVNRPGRYELVDTRDLTELIAVAGGLAPGATYLLPVSVVSRLSDDRQDQKLVTLAADGTPPNVSLRREDAVRIPTYSELQRSVTVIGAIGGAQLVRGKTGDTATLAAEETSATRRMPFVEGDTVRTLLDRAGGVVPLADLNGSYIVRKGKAIPVRLHALLMLKDLTADVAIELDDTLVVPFKRRNILVEGAVFRPGEYPFNPSYQIDEYLSLAGGMNRFAQDVSEVRVVTPTGQLLAYRNDLAIDPGSTLVVPERSFSRSEVVTIILAAASIALAGATLVITAKK
jgi:protein involved in polysaccharide export with SLBB domain